MMRRVVMRSGSTLSPTTRDVLRLAVEMVSEVMNAGVVSLMAKENGGGLVIEAALGLGTTAHRAPSQWSVRVRHRSVPL